MVNSKHMFLGYKIELKIPNPQNNNNNTEIHVLE